MQDLLGNELLFIYSETCHRNFLIIINIQRNVTTNVEWSGVKQHLFL